MVQIQNSWFPLVDRNPQKFTDIYHADEKDFQKAIGYYQRLFDEKKQSDLRSTTTVRIGECYSKSGQFQKSIDYFAAEKPSVTDSTEKAAADYCVAEDYYNLQDFVKARTLYEEFCKNFPLNPLVRTVTYSIGWTYMKTNEFAKAAAVFGDLARWSGFLAPQYGLQERGNRVFCSER